MRLLDDPNYEWAGRPTAQGQAQERRPKRPKGCKADCHRKPALIRKPSASGGIVRRQRRDCPSPATRLPVVNDAIARRQRRALKMGNPIKMEDTTNRRSSIFGTIPQASWKLGHSSRHRRLHTQRLRNAGCVTLPRNPLQYKSNPI